MSTKLSDDHELVIIRERHRYGDRQTDSDIRRLFGEIDWLRNKLKEIETDRDEWRRVANEAIRLFERAI